MVNLIKPWPFWWTFVHFDQLFGLTLGQKGHLGQMYWSNVTCVFHAPTFNQNGHTFWSMRMLWSSWHSKKMCFSCSEGFLSFQNLCTFLMFFNNLLSTYAMNINIIKTRISKVHRQKIKTNYGKNKLKSNFKRKRWIFKKKHKVCK